MKCKKCRNIAEIGGAAITPYTCEKCGNGNFYMITRTPKICPICSENYHLCETCGKLLYSDEIGESLSQAEQDTGVPASKLLQYLETGKITKKDFKKIQEYYESLL